MQMLGWLIYFAVGLFITGYVRKHHGREWLKNSNDEEILCFYVFVTFGFWPLFLTYLTWQFFTRPVNK